MARIFSSDEETPPTIKRHGVMDFFRQRARKISQLGPLRAVIYQDHHPDLAEQRDGAEKAALLPLMALTGRERVLDVGCGTGRWTATVLSGATAYHGIDASAELIAWARNAFRDEPRCRFSVISADALSLAALSETESFDVILCAGVLMYLNDDDVRDAFRGFEQVCRPTARILLREPMGLGKRLTIQEQFSEDMEQFYSAIYRTEGGFLRLAEEPLLRHGFAVAGAGDVYADAALNNRAETRQRWLLLERK